MRCKPILDNYHTAVIVHAVIAIASRPAEEADGDERRRSLLAESDALLDEVEALHLDDHVEAPPTLREAIRALQIRLGRHDPPLPPATLRAAHDLVFAVQQRIMAANPKNPRPNRHVGRPGGQPIVTMVRDERRWKLLTLPPPPSGAGDEECSSNQQWSERGIAGATRSSTPSAARVNISSRTSHSPSRKQPG
jgi:hypothetical protein